MAVTIFKTVEELVEPGVATEKLSKMTVPGAFVSVCQVPALSSKMIDDVEIEEFHVSVYCYVQVPGTPLLPVAVSMYTLPESLRMRRNLWLVEL